MANSEKTKNGKRKRKNENKYKNGKEEKKNKLMIK